MNNFKEKLIKFFTSKGFERILWVTANSIIAITIQYLADIDWLYVPAIVIALNEITKYINVEYLKD